MAANRCLVLVLLCGPLVVASLIPSQPRQGGTRDPALPHDHAPDAEKAPPARLNHASRSQAAPPRPAGLGDPGDMAVVDVADSICGGAPLTESFVMLQTAEFIVVGCDLSTGPGVAFADTRAPPSSYASDRVLVAPIPYARSGLPCQEVRQLVSPDNGRLVLLRCKSGALWSIQLNSSSQGVTGSLTLLTEDVAIVESRPWLGSGFHVWQRSRTSAPARIVEYAYSSSSGPAAAQSWEVITPCSVVWFTDLAVSSPYSGQSKLFYVSCDEDSFNGTVAYYEAGTARPQYVQRGFCSGYGQVRDVRTAHCAPQPHGAPSTVTRASLRSSWTRTDSW
jgi:hypothetical protein